MRSKWKILFLCGFVLMGLAGCSAPRGTDGKTKVDQIIASEKIEIPKSQVNTTEIGDETLKKEYGKLKDSDTITIEPTGFGATLSQSWFDGLIVWPIAQLINVFASWTDAGVGIILATLLIQLVVFAFTYKSQLASQRMQEIQPELTRIQNKYKDKTDDRSRMLMAQETQKIYQKYDIHPFGTILVTFIQLPIMMGMYYATMRASAVVYGSFLGMSLSETPISTFALGIILHQRHRHIHPEAVTAHAEPKPHNILHRLQRSAGARSIHGLLPGLFRLIVAIIQRRLVREKVDRAGAVPLRNRTETIHAVRTLPNSICPHVAVCIRIALRLHRFPEPGVLNGGMAGHQIQ